MVSNFTTPSVRANNVSSLPLPTLAGQHGRAALTNQDGACGNRFTAIGFHAQAFGVGIATVACGACAFLMCHGLEGMGGR